MVGMPENGNIRMQTLEGCLCVVGAYCDDPSGTRGVQERVFSLEFSRPWKARGSSKLERTEGRNERDLEEDGVCSERSE